MNEKLLKAIEDGKVKDETTLAVFEMLQTIEDKIDSKEIEKVEVTNFPEEKEMPEPIINVASPVVNVPAPVVNVEAPVVNIDTEELKTTLKEILDKLNSNQPFTLDKVAQNGRIRVEVDRVGSFSSFAIVDALIKGSYLSSTSTNGTRDLTSANTWYSVPSTVPASPYILVATIENSVGTVRFGFDNTGTPSATNGNQAPSQLTIRLAANQVIYYASSTAGDDVNWTTKII